MFKCHMVIVFSPAKVKIVNHGLTSLGKLYHFTTLEFTEMCRGKLYHFTT